MIEQVRSKVSTFESKIRVRNGLEYAAAVVVVASFGYQVFTAPNIFLKTGAVLVILAAILVVYLLHTRGSAKDMPEDLGRAASLDFYRTSLARQRDLLQSVWSWYLLPFVPGILLILFGAAVRDGAILNQPAPIEKQGAAGGIGIFIVAAVFVIFFFLVAAFNKRKARKLQAELDELEKTY